MVNANATKQPEIVAPDLLTDEQAAALLSIEPRTLRAWRNSRGLPFIKITSKVIRYRRADINSWLGQHRVACVRGAR